MKTLVQIREEQQQLEEAAIRAYVIEGEKFAKALAAALGVTVVELTKSLGLSMAKNPVKTIIAAPFIALFAWWHGMVIGAGKAAWYAIMVPLISAIMMILGHSPIGAYGIAGKLGIGTISVGGLMVAFYGKRVGTKVIKAWNKSLAKHDIKYAEKPDEKAGKALAKLMKRK